MNRREFIQKTGIFTAMALAAPTILSAEPAKGKEFTVIILGAGRRARDAFKNLTEAAKKIGATIRLVAAQDFFPDVAKDCCSKLGFEKAKAFGGPAAYHDAVEIPADIVICAAPPAFRPLHVEAALKAGHHVFAEKPGAVDAPGARRLIAAAALAQEKKLSLVAGTQRRHQGAYLCQANALQKGELGRILGGEVYWCQASHGSCRERRPTDSNAAYMANNWMNWSQMSGDHICEQHVHNLDIACWFIGRYPRVAVGVGGRAQRKSGNQYDFFSVDYDFGENLHIHSLSRQITGCWSRVGEFFRTETAEISGGGIVRRYNGQTIKLENAGNEGNPYVNEHSFLLDSILNGRAANEGENLAKASIVAIMGRISAYTGQAIRFSDLLTQADSPYYDFRVSPCAEDFEKAGDIVLPQENVIPLAGKY